MLRDMGDRKEVVSVLWVWLADKVNRYPCSSIECAYVHVSSLHLHVQATYTCRCIRTLPFTQNIIMHTLTLTFAHMLMYTHISLYVLLFF